MGPDRNLWFAENGAAKIGKITTGGTITEYTIPTSGPEGIAVGPDGNLWFTEYAAGKIGKMTIGGTVTEYIVPTSGSQPSGIAAGPDGNLWFTEHGGNKIGKITTGGTISEYVIPTSTSYPSWIVAGPDGNIWFTEYGGNRIGMCYTYGQAFAHLALGPSGSDVWTTAIILNNTTDSQSSFMINFLQDSGQPLLLGLGIAVETHQVLQQYEDGHAVFGTVPARNSVTLVLSSSTFLEGWATLGGSGIAGQVVFHRHTSAGADYEATVPLSMGGTEYIVPFDASYFFNGTAQVTSLPYITGMALANLDPSNTAIINCAIRDPNGSSLGSATPITLAPMGHTALQLNAGSGFASVAGNIGSLDCSSNGILFSVLGLRFLGSNDLTSFAAIKLH